MKEYSRYSTINGLENQLQLLGKIRGPISRWGIKNDGKSDVHVIASVYPVLYVVQ